MSDLPEDLFYTKDHEWVKMNDDGSATVGITQYAQESLGDITFVEFPSAGSRFEAGDTFGVVESVKAASDLYMPISGEVLEVNEAVDSSPELINASPFGEGWLLRVKPDDAAQIETLMNASDYAKLI